VPIHGKRQFAAMAYRLIRDSSIPSPVEPRPPGARTPEELALSLRELAVELAGAGRECRDKARQIEAHTLRLERLSRTMSHLRRTNAALREETASLQLRLAQLRAATEDLPPDRANGRACISRV
jgi:hypothetical protein